jgi:diguanylate cyclase (GGDEF)-like protein
VFFDVTDQVAREEKLNRRLMTDPLTGLKNRHGFDTALQAIDLEGGAAFAIFYLDMNGFKHVNDTLGHDAGDELLTVAARRFSSVVRDGDVVARLGGDEFGICLHGSITPAHAQVVVDKLKSSLSSPIRIKKGEVSVGVAVGFSIRIPTDTSTDEVVQRADAAMYQNKKASSELPPVGDPVLMLARTN